MKLFIIVSTKSHRRNQKAFVIDKRLVFLRIEDTPPKEKFIDEQVVGSFDLNDDFKKLDTI